MPFRDALLSCPQRLVEPPARLIVRAGIHPNVVSLFGFLLSGGVAWLLCQGHFLWGGLLLLMAGAFDILDGAVARMGGQATRFGALLDSTLDRLSEAVVLFGLLALYLSRGAALEVMLIFATLVASILVSYVRARAEGLGLRGRGGIMPRQVRVVLLALGLVVGQVQAALWLIALLSGYSAVERLWRARLEATQSGPNDD